MKQQYLILTVQFIFSAFIVNQAEQYLNLPIAPGGKEIVSPTPNTYTMEYRATSLNEILNFYKKELKDQSEINWKERITGEKTVIHDWGNRKWHKITILKKARSVQIEIKKDSWTWILGTLIIRFIGVFIVLIVLMIVLLFSGAVFSKAR